MPNAHAIQSQCKFALNLHRDVAFNATDSQVELRINTDARDSKSGPRKGVLFQVPPSVLIQDKQLRWSLRGPAREGFSHVFGLESRPES